MWAVRITLTALIVVLCDQAAAYTPTTTNTCSFTWAGGGTSGSAASESAAEASVIAQKSGYMTDAGWTEMISCSGTCTNYTGSVCGDLPGSGTPTSKTKYWKYTYTGTITQPGPGWYVQATRTSSSQSCPGGGTLSGGSCVCPSGYTDSGTACVPPSCPATQVYSSAAGACVNRCLDAGKAWNPLDHSSTLGSAGLTFAQGASTTCVGFGSGAAESQCEVEPTFTPMVCADGKCFSEGGRYTGRMCGTGGTAPSSTPAMDTAATPTTCDAGDLWCKSSTGACGSGFTAGTFNGKTICAKVGEAVAIVPQNKSPNVPPPSTPLQPSSWTDPTARSGESINPSDRLVISIGGAATTFPGTGSGGTGDGTCGAPGEPPCKIDETGTPTGSGAFSGATGTLNEKTDAIKGLGSEATKTDGKDTSWKIGFNPPSGCVNPSALVLPGGINWTPDLCAYSSQIGAVMSFLWYLLTLGSCLSMIRSTMTQGA